MRTGGDFLVALAFGDELQNFALARGEQFVAVFDFAILQLADVILDQHAADGGAEERLAGMHRADGGDEIGFRRFLQQIRLRRRP